jgi:hypothetical protein
MKKSKWFSLIIKNILAIILAITGLWCAGSVYYNVAGTVGMCFFAISSLILLIGFMRGNNFMAADLAMLEILIIWNFCRIEPNDVFSHIKWQQPWEKRASADFNGDIATIYNVRNFSYRTENDYSADYITMNVDLNKVSAMDVALSHWDGMEAIAHSMLSFEFTDGQHLAFSVETRLPDGAGQGFIPGLYKQYELLIIIGTEDDLFKLRTNYRKEVLYLYRSNADPEQCKTILRALLKASNRHVQNPRFYNSITKNCTTSLTPMLRWLNSTFHGDIRLLLNGHSDELLFELGYLKHRSGESFQELEQRRRLAPVQSTDIDYSDAIRVEI